MSESRRRDYITPKMRNVRTLAPVFESQVGSGFQTFDPCDTDREDPHAILYIKAMDLEVYLKPDQARWLGERLVRYAERHETKNK